MREIILDTETTGLSPDAGHRVIEIGCIELINKIKTGRTFHTYINPKRDVPNEAFRIHGISTEFLTDKPIFSEIYQEFYDFIEGSALVIHNAGFDMKFLQAEFKWLGSKKMPHKTVIDTLDMARRKFPGSPASLDALCRRFGIDNTKRTYHGALLDAELLVGVYLELTGSIMPQMQLNSANEETKAEFTIKDRVFRKSRGVNLSNVDLVSHNEILKKLKKPMWEDA